MSGKVLSAGSAQPPLEPGKVRLYGFEYSPYVQRVHMVLIAKNIPYDVKNIDLKNKPDWFLKLNPAGKVPVLDTGDKVLTESLEIVVFLDKNYPGTTLRNTDPEKSAKDKEIVEKFEGLRKELSEAIKNKDYKSAETIAILSLFQSELEKRGTTFLAGKLEEWGRCGSVAQTSTTLPISTTPTNNLHDPIATAPPPESPAYQTSEYLQPESPACPLQTEEVKSEEPINLEDLTMYKTYSNVKIMGETSYDFILGLGSFGNVFLPKSAYYLDCM
uniref:GST N-terminal domain-containing protein n=1 Tax=Timema tahoe TaxID=61484 RepID=A0A7R9IB76_9NEOP|nr:unnamed protein product [Timema tahoe]